MIGIIGLDVGDKRVGVAVGSLFPRISSPYAIYDRAKGSAEEKIISLIKERSIKIIVAGLPLNDDNTFNDQCLKIEKFCIRIKRRAKVKIVFVDEFSSSAEANEKLAELRKLSLAKKKQTKKLDSLAASIILESYLEHGPQVVVKELAD